MVEHVFLTYKFWYKAFALWGKIFLAFREKFKEHFLLFPSQEIRIPFFVMSEHNVALCGISTWGSCIFHGADRLSKTFNFAQQILMCQSKRTGNLLLFSSEWQFRFSQLGKPNCISRHEFYLLEMGKIWQQVEGLLALLKNTSCGTYVFLDTRKWSNWIS